MELKPSFLGSIVEAVADRLDVDEVGRIVAQEIDTDAVFERAVGDIAEDVKEREVIEAAADAIADDVDEEEVVDGATEKLVDRLADDEDFIDRVAGKVAERIVAALTVDAQRSVKTETVPVQSSGDLTRGPAGCPRCGGSLFLHPSDGSCPTSSAAVA